MMPTIKVLLCCLGWALAIVSIAAVMHNERGDTDWPLRTTHLSAHHWTSP